MQENGSSLQANTIEGDPGEDLALLTGLVLLLVAIHSPIW